MVKKSYIQFLGTLSNKNRLEIILALKKKPLCVSDLVKKLNINQTTISHNLKRLEICGFVNVKQKGKFRFYSLNKKTIVPLLNLIEKHTCKYCSNVVNDIKISKRYKTTKL